MRIEWWILIAVYPAAAFILSFIPKNKIRPAVVAFLFTQVITFLMGLVVVELGLLEYPVRFFASVNRASFTFEYFAFPAVCAFFYVRYPHDRSTFFRLGYYAGFSLLLTIIEIIIQKTTSLIKYIHWEWYISWITICISLFIVRLFCNWFFERERA